MIQAMFSPFQFIPRWLRLVVVAVFWGAAATSLAAGSDVTKRLRVLAWPGYADAEIVKSFEQRHGAHVELTVIDSDAVLWQKLSANQGGDFDVFAVNTAELQRYIDARLAQPVEPKRIANTRRQLPRFRDLSAIPGLVRKDAAGAKAYGIPYTYAAMGLIYDRRQIASPPQSIAALWDPTFRGKVIAYDGGTHNFSLAAQYMGATSLFRLTDAQWPRAVDELIALRRNALGFYHQPEESVRLFQRHNAALMFANYGMQQVHLLKAVGADIGYVIPREGALAWLDCWVIARGAADSTLAHDWINHVLEDQASEFLVKRQGLANTITDAATDQAGDRLRWLEPVEDVTRRELLWDRIRSGSRAAHVLAP